LSVIRKFRNWRFSFLVQPIGFDGHSARIRILLLPLEQDVVGERDDGLYQKDRDATQTRGVKPK
jgi:hypothetical protein